MSDTREVRQYLRDAQGYLEHAIAKLDEPRKARQCMARVRECLSEASWRLRGCPIKNGGRA